MSWISKILEKRERNRDNDFLIVFAEALCEHLGSLQEGHKQLLAGEVVLSPEQEGVVEFEFDGRTFSVTWDHNKEALLIYSRDGRWHSLNNKFFDTLEILATYDAKTQQTSVGITCSDTLLGVANRVKGVLKGAGLRPCFRVRKISTPENVEKERQSAGPGNFYFENPARTITVDVRESGDDLQTATADVTVEVGGSFRLPDPKELRAQAMYILRYDFDVHDLDKVIGAFKQFAEQCRGNGSGREV